MVQRKRILTENFEIIFCTIQLVEAYVCFDRHAAARITKIGVTAGYNGEALSFRFPGKLSNGV